MPNLHKKGLFDLSRVIFLPPELISPNPDQPRKHFDPAGLEELASSIRESGILQPLSVRRANGRYELVAGERRLRAAELCGLEEVPCLVLDVNREDSCLLSLVENLQRRDLDFWEEAQALEKLIAQYGLSQEEAAAKVGKSQSAVANKLRLLKLPSQALELLRRSGCTERHARALLKLPDPDSQLAAARFVAKNGLTVSKTEAYVASKCAQYSDAPAALPPKKTAFLIRDVRFFLNTVTRGLTLMQSAGVNAQCDKVEEDDSILLTIRIPKQQSSRG